jgi:hypothetical protein
VRRINAVKVGHDPGGNRDQPQLLGAQDPAITAQDHIEFVDQHRNGEAELPNAGCEFRQLLGGVLARIAGVGRARAG